MANDKLRFDVRTLDPLFSPDNKGLGIRLPDLPHTTSLCLIGPNGTGKSVFGLHLARAYYQDHQSNTTGEHPTRVVYISTDLKVERATRVLENFHNGKASPRLIELSPNSDTEALRNYLSPPNPDSESGIGFFDLASSTAGDDWGFVNRILAHLETPDLNPSHRAPRHLVVIDAIEGLETLAGEHDAFGLLCTRRQRVANLMRLAENKAHLVLVVEEAAPKEGNPEEFIADIVIRLRTERAGNHARRTIEIEKARALDGYVHGRHAFHIGEDLYTSPPVYTRGVIEVYPALHSFEDGVEPQADGGPPVRFGLPYLDDMLGEGRGLKAGKVAAIVGEPSTLKSDLGCWFLSGAYPEKGGPTAAGSGLGLLFTARPETDALHDVVECAKDRGRDHATNVVRCHRLPVADLPSSQVYWMIRRHLENTLAEFDGPQPGDESVVHRLVIDDLTSFRDTYPEIAQDPLFLPKLTSLLECGGSLFKRPRHHFVPLLISTQDGKPGAQPAEHFDQTLRNLVDLRIHTWPVPFYGQQRVAISTNMTAHGAEPILVRELCRRAHASAEGKLALFVDPHFELYRDLEIGKPEHVALEIRMFSETEAFDKYIDSENHVLNELFLPRNASSPGASVITKVPQDQYEVLRDFCNLKAGTQIEHTLILQVDEFWDPPAGTFRNQRKYLRDTPVYTKEGSHSEEDPLLLYNINKKWARDTFWQLRRPRQTDPATAGAEGKRTPEPIRLYRDDFFVLRGRTTFSLTPDRVPFMWDYGFLLLDRDAWRDAEDRKLHYECRELTVRDVWKSLRTPPDKRPEFVDGVLQPNSQRTPADDAGTTAEKIPWCSWRMFLEAALEVARVARLGRRSPVRAFDASVVSGESISSLILEMWMSEIYLRKRRQPAPRDKEAARFGNELAARLGCADDPARPSLSLPSLLREFWRELYMIFLLLVEVLDFDAIAAPEDPYTFLVRPGTEGAVAARHWYKTAAFSEQTQFKDRPSMPARLPGHFSVRGDWYLAVAAGSRSSRLADRGLDFLNSRRASLSRLQQGLGLPLSDVCGVNEYQYLPTALTYFRTKSPESESSSGPPDRRATLPYWDLFAELGACPAWLLNLLGRSEDEFYWLWRNRLEDYGRHMRIWENFMLAMVRFWRRVKTDEGGEWKPGFELYDDMCRHPDEPRELYSYRSFHRRAEHVAREMEWVSRTPSIQSGSARGSGLSPEPSPNAPE